MMKLAVLLLFSLVFAGMAKAGTIDRSALTKKVRTTSISAFTQVQGIETYYGYKIDVKELKNYRPGITMGNVYQAGEVILKSGESLPATDVEYALVPIIRPSFHNISGNFGPEVAKAPHEQN